MKPFAIRLLAAPAALLVFISIVSPASASEWGVVLNGRSFHVNADRNWNESNWGLGVEREFQSYGPWVKIAVANGFVDSRYEMSYMAGAGIKHRRWLGGGRFYRDLGIVAFLMTRDDINHGKPFLGALPTLTLGTRSVAMNVTYMPAGAVNHKADPSLHGVLFFQFKLDASLFGFGGRGPWLADSGE